MIALLSGDTNKQEMMMKNAMFQFYDGVNVIDDTGLITLDEANELFESRKEAFANSLQLGRDCEMCIWHECRGEEDYEKTYKRWCSGDVKFDGRNFWVKE